MQDPGHRKIVDALRGAKDAASVCSAAGLLDRHIAEESADGVASAEHAKDRDRMRGAVQEECGRVSEPGALLSVQFAARMAAWFARHEVEFEPTSADNATAKLAPATESISAESTAVGAVRQSVLVPK